MNSMLEQTLVTKITFIKFLKGKIMAQMNRKDLRIEGTPKNTRQGAGQNTKYAATSANKKKPKYRGQGR